MQTKLYRPIVKPNKIDEESCFYLNRDVQSQNGSDAIRSHSVGYLGFHSGDHVFLCYLYGQN